MFKKKFSFRGDFACVVNIAGDLLFVAVFQMDVAGAAFATILAQLVSVVLSLVIIKMQELPFSVSWADIGFNPEIKNFLKLGFPIALQDMLVNISFLILCAIVNGIGLEASSGYGIAQKVTAFVMLIPSALMQSMSAFVAQNVGAGKEERAKKAMVTGMVIGACIGVFIFVFSLFGGNLPSAVLTSAYQGVDDTFALRLRTDYDSLLRRCRSQACLSSTRPALRPCWL